MQSSDPLEAELRRLSRNSSFDSSHRPLLDAARVALQKAAELESKGATEPAKRHRHYARAALTLLDREAARNREGFALRGTQAREARAQRHANLTKGELETLRAELARLRGETSP